MSCQIKCGKCSVLFDKEQCSTRKNDYYRTCQSCRDKINSRYSKSKKSVKPKQQVENEPVEPESVEPPNDFNWKEVVFGKSKPVVNEEPNEENESNEESEQESEKPESEKPESESEPPTGYADHINEPIVFRADDADKPISFDDLQTEIKSKHVITKPTFFDISDNENKELTVSQKLSKIIEMLENTTSQLTKKVDGYDTSTKCLLEKINSNVIKSQMITGTPDTNYSAYEIKVDKLATRINELETNLKLFISTTTASTTQLKQCVSESEDNLRQALHHIYSKI